MDFRKICFRVYPIMVLISALYAAVIFSRIPEYRVDPPYILSWFVGLWWATDLIPILFLLAASLALTAIGNVIFNGGEILAEFVRTQPDKYRIRSLSITLVFGIIGIYAAAYGLVGLVRFVWCVSQLVS
ncbi:MAG: hypothetical protein JXA92_09560 [candidate division Zixibacteria bacterium]|nr:hypothetical protein [candidate division Zixibacteria bacterium]